MAVYLDPITNPEAWDTVVFAGSLRTPGVCVVGKWDRKNDYDIKTGKGTAGATETLKGQPPAEGTITFSAWTPAHFAAWNPILDALRFDPAKGVQAGSQGKAAPAAQPVQGGQQFTDTSPAADENAAAPATGTIPSPTNTSGTSSGTTNKSDSGTSTPPALSAASAIDIFHPALADIGVYHVLPPEELGSWEPDGEAALGKWKREIKFVEFTQPPAASIAATPTGSTNTTAQQQQFADGTQESSAPTAAAGGSQSAGASGQSAHGAGG